MSNPVEILLAHSTALAQRNNLPTKQAQRQERFDARDITAVELGDMLALAAIVPMPGIDVISLFAYDGDEAILSTLHGYVSGSTLQVTADIPFKAGQRQSSGGGDVFNNVSGSVFGTYISAGTIMGDININLSESSSFTSMSRGSEMTILIDGREVDLERAVRFALLVPDTMDIEVKGIIGAIGITDYLNALLTFEPERHTELTASSVRALSAGISSHAQLHVDEVVEDATVSATSHSDVTIGSIGGDADITALGHSHVTINGGTSAKLKAVATGHSRISHLGSVLGATTVSATGHSHVVVRDTQAARPRVTVVGHSSATINGQPNTGRR